MRKSIFCTVLLCVLASVLMAVPAFATEYFRVLSITPSKTTYKFTDAYAESKDLSQAAITFNISALYRSDDRLPSGYNNGNTIAWTVTVDPENMDPGTITKNNKGEITANSKVRINDTNTTTLTKAAVEAGTITVNLLGRLKGDATITVTATQAPASTGGQGATITKKLPAIKITMKDKPDPVVSMDKKEPTRLLAVWSGTPLLGTDKASFDKRNGTITLSSDLTTAAISFANYPESMSISPTPKKLYDDYKITLTDVAGTYNVSLKKDTNPNAGTKDLTNLDAYNYNQLGTATSAQLTSATTKRVLTFGAGDTNENKANGIQKSVENLPIKITVWNKKADGSAGDKVEKTIYLTIRQKYYPKGFSAEKGTAVTTVTAKGNTGTVYDLGPLFKNDNAHIRDVPEKNTEGKTHELKGLKMVKTGAELLAAANVQWKVKDISMPALVYATGLPEGMTLKAYSAGTSPKLTKGDEFTATLTGSPTKPGYYDNIRIIVSNDAGIWSKDYVMDVVNPTLAITTEAGDLPNMTWGVKYEATVTATSSDNPYHPTVFSLEDKVKNTTTLRSPGLTIARKTGVLSGKLESSDRALEALKLSADYALSGDAEKTIKVKVAISNDWTAKASGTGAIKSVSQDVTFTLKAVKPELKSTVVSTQNAFNNARLMFGKEVSLDQVISVKGPGAIKFSFDNFPDGFQFDTVDDTANAIVNASFYANPTMTAKNQNATVTISNAAGSVKVPIKISIGANASDFTLSMDNEVKQVKIGTSIDNVAIDAAFGPVKWTAQNLPKGLKLSVDKSVSNDTRVWIVGAPTASTKIDKNGQSVYTIIATDSTVPKENDKLEVKISQDLKIFPKPKIITNSLPAITLDKAYSAKITGSGGGAKDQKWVVTIEEVTAENSSKASKKGLPSIKKVLDSGDSDLTKTFSVDCEELPQKKFLIVSADAKTGMPTITGSLDRMPASGRLKVSIKLSLGSGDALDTVSSDPITVYVKGTPVKIGNASLKEFSRTDTTVSYDIKATGTHPIYMEAYVRSADVASLLNLPGHGNISLDAQDNITGIFFSSDLSGNGKLISTGTGSYSFKNLPIHIKAGNTINYNSKTGYVEPAISTDKTFKVTMPGVKPVWLRGEESDGNKASADVTFFAVDSVDITNIVYTVSADRPYEIKVTPAGKKNGLTPTVTQATSNAAGFVTISGKPTAGKETKTQFTLLVTNTATKEKEQVKLTILGEQRPTVTTKMDSNGYVADKIIEAGKSLNYKITAKGSRKSYSKTTNAHETELSTNNVAYSAMTWSIADTNNGTDLDKLEAIGLSFDRGTGTFKGTATATTSADGAYTPLVFVVKPVNSTNEDENDGVDADKNASAKVRIGVKGKKPKITTKTISLYRDSEDQYTYEDNKLATNLTNDESANIKWAWSGTAADTADTWGLSKTIASSGNLGQLAPGGSDGLPKATKGITLKVSADNMGNSATANVKIIIKDADPTISGATSVAMESAKDSAELTTEEYELGDSDAQMTGDTKMLWKIAKNAGNSKVKASLKAYSDGTGCTVTIKADKKISPDVHTSFVISVTNQSTKVTTLKVVSVDVSKFTDLTALPEEKDSSEEEAELTKDTLSADKALSGDELPAGEGTVTYGEARGESALTEAERTALSEGGYIIAAILPEITTDESGQYDLDAVSLDEAAPVDYELAWFAFPRRAESSDDDSIAEFYDEAGAEVFAVPESRKVIPSPWLEKEVTYAPVIAVKAPSAGNAKTSLDEAKEGDTVTTNALEEAAGKSAEESADSEAEPEVISEESKHEETETESPEAE